MARYTVQLQRMLDSGVTLDLENPNTYPIFDENYRATLNALILNHFKYREIGAETPELFKHYFHRRLREIMPYYNELYKSQLIVFNPLYSTDSQMTSTTNTTYDGTSTESSTANNESTATGRTLLSSTPQTQLLGHEDYASGLTDNTTNGTGTADSKEDSETHHANVTEYTYHVAGYSGQNPSEAIMRFRQSLINVNIMVLGELESVFMGLW